jgi:hypothetical protein
MWNTLYFLAEDRASIVPRVSRISPIVGVENESLPWPFDVAQRRLWSEQKPNEREHLDLPPGTGISS